MWHVFANVGGHLLHFCIPDRAFEERKLTYGLAHIEQELPSMANPRPAEVIVDDVVDPEGEVLRLILAEHLDRFEETDHDWTTQNATPPLEFAKEHEKRHGKKPTRKRAREAPITIPVKAPRMRETPRRTLPGGKDHPRIMRREGE